MAQESATQLLSHFGYLAVLGGSVLEGETFLVAAGFLAHQGYLSLPLVIAAGAVGSVAADLGLFLLARRKGQAVLDRFPRLAGKMAKLTERLGAHPGLLYLYAFIFRFLYGLRTVSPLFLGLSRLPAPAFFLLNLTGAFLWSWLFASAGFYFARSLRHLLGSLARHEFLIAGALLAAGLGLALWLRQRRAKPGAMEEEQRQRTGD